MEGEQLSVAVEEQEDNGKAFQWQKEWCAAMQTLRSIYQSQNTMMINRVYIESAEVQWSFLTK